MYKNKCLTLISSVSPAQIKDLLRFVKFCSPTKAKVISMLIKEYSSITHNNTSLNKNKVFSRLFPGEKFQDVKLRLLQSELVHLIEKYITYTSIDEDNYVYNRAILDFYKKKNLSSLKRKLLSKLERKSASVDALHQDKLSFDLYLAEQFYDEAMQQRKVGEQETTRLQEVIDREYIIRKLRYSCLVISQENVYDIQYDHGLKEHVLEYIEENCLYEEPGIGLYYYCYKMLSERRDFDHFRVYLRTHGSRFSEDQNKELYTLVINFCIRSLNQGDKTYAKMGIDFYKEGLENGILLSNGEISKFTFRNIVTMAIRVGEFETAEDFIQDFRDLLSPKDKQDMVTFTTALVLFSQGRYDEASQEIIKVNFKDLLFTLASRALQVKIYYESDEFLLLASHLDAMSIFLKRHKTLGYHKQNYLNMIAYTRKLMNARSVEKLNKLRVKLDEEKTLIEKQWFVDKTLEKLKIHSKR